MATQVLALRFVSMAPIWIVVTLAANCVLVSCGTHSLFHKYTFMSNPPKIPGTRRFVATTWLDDLVIDYYDSDISTKTPKRSWNNRRSDYIWLDGTASRSRKQKWFAYNAEKLRKSLRLNVMDNHVLQAYHGCKAHKRSDGTWEFLDAWDTVAYDGRAFMSFGLDTKTYIPLTTAAYQTSRKWNAFRRPVNADRYLTTQCLKNLITAVEIRERTISRLNVTPQGPRVYAIQSHTRDHATRLLCWATGFPWTDAAVYVGRHDGTSMDDTRYYVNTGVRPNGDGTFQASVAVDVDIKERTMYTCSLNMSGLVITKRWSNEVDADSRWTIPTILMTCVFVILCNCKIVIIWRKYKQE